MQFEPKDFADLHLRKIINGVTSLHLSQCYFFCYLDKMVFITKSKGFFKVVASCQCGFKPLYKDTNFDVVFTSKDISEVIDKFEFFVDLIICRAYRH